MSTRLSNACRSAAVWVSSYRAEPGFSPLVWQISPRTEPVASSIRVLGQPGNAHRLPDLPNSRLTVCRDGSEPEGPRLPPVLRFALGTRPAPRFLDGARLFFRALATVPPYPMA